MLRKLAQILPIFIILFGVLSFNTPAHTQSYDFSENSGLKNTSNQAGYDTNNVKTPESYISKIITIILSFIGVLFLGFTIYAGITWMTAAGKEEKVTKAKEMMSESIIGLIIVLVAYALTYFIIKMTSGTLIQ